jgi:hypothetical protein
VPAKKTLIFGLCFRKAFFIRKKLTALFIFLTFSINGFAPSAAEVGKYSFIMTAVTVTKNLASQVFKKYDESLTMIAGSVFSNVKNSLKNTPLNRSADKAAGGECPDEESNAANDAYLTHSAANEKMPALCCDSFGGSRNLIFLSKTCIANSALCAIIILFLLFIAAILRRKDICGGMFNINILKKGFPA